MVSSGSTSGELDALMPHDDDGDGEYFKSRPA